MLALGRLRKCISIIHYANDTKGTINLQAGIVIALEAGCYVTGSRDFFHAHRDEDPSEFKDWDELIWGRKYIVIRYA